MSKHLELALSFLILCGQCFLNQTSWFVKNCSTIPPLNPQEALVYTKAFECKLSLIVRGIAFSFIHCRCLPSCLQCEYPMVTAVFFLSKLVLNLKCLDNRGGVQKEVSNSVWGFKKVEIFRYEVFTRWKTIFRVPD